MQGQHITYRSATALCWYWTGDHVRLTLNR